MFGDNAEWGILIQSLKHLTRSVLYLYLQYYVYIQNITACYTPIHKYIRYLFTTILLDLAAINHLQSATARPQFNIQYYAFGVSSRTDPEDIIHNEAQLILRYSHPWAPIVVYHTIHNYSTRARESTSYTYITMSVLQYKRINNNN